MKSSDSHPCVCAPPRRAEPRTKPTKSRPDVAGERGARTTTLECRCRARRVHTGALAVSMCVCVFANTVRACSRLPVSRICVLCCRCVSFQRERAPRVYPLRCDAHVMALCFRKYINPRSLELSFVGGGGAAAAATDVHSPPAPAPPRWAVRRVRRADTISPFRADGLYSVWGFARMLTHARTHARPDLRNLCLV